MDTPHGRLLLGILIVQDLAVVPMMLAIPALAGGAGRGLPDALAALGKTAATAALLVLAARFAVPRLLRALAGTRQKAIFVVAVLLLVFGTALAASRAGLSAALGAFLAGLVISESEYGHQAMADVLPFRDAFNALFFVSIGMLFDPRILSSEPVLVGVLLLLILVGKTAFSALPVRLLGYGLGVATVVGLTLAQIGEFSFILLKQGQSANLISPELYQAFLGAAIVSMAVTPWISERSHAFAERISRSHGAAFPRRRPGAALVRPRDRPRFRPHGRDAGARARTGQGPHSRSGPAPRPGRPGEGPGHADRVRRRRQRPRPEARRHRRRARGSRPALRSPRDAPGRPPLPEPESRHLPSGAHEVSRPRSPSSRPSAPTRSLRRSSRRRSRSPAERCAASVSPCRGSRRRPTRSAAPGMTPSEASAPPRRRRSSSGGLSGRRASIVVAVGPGLGRGRSVPPAAQPAGPRRGERARRHPGRRADGLTGRRLRPPGRRPGASPRHGGRRREGPGAPPRLTSAQEAANAAPRLSPATRAVRRRSASEWAVETNQASNCAGGRNTPPSRIAWKNAA